MKKKFSIPLQEKLTTSEGSKAEQKVLSGDVT